MKFADWVHAPVKGKRLNEATVASNRLKYIITHAALQIGCPATVSGFAERAQVPRTHLYHYIRRGTFPQKTAEAIERVIGRSLICAEHLVFPMNIDVDAE
jgi:hypothetical protein